MNCRSNLCARYKRSHEACEECGRFVGCEVHHIVPVADGGTNEDENLITLCAECHERKHLKDRGRLISEGMKNAITRCAMMRISRFEIYVWLDEMQKRGMEPDGVCGLLDMIDSIPLLSNREYRSESEMRENFAAWFGAI